MKRHRFRFRFRVRADENRLAARERFEVAAEGRCVGFPQIRADTIDVLRYGIRNISDISPLSALLQLDSDVAYRLRRCSDVLSEIGRLPTHLQPDQLRADLACAIDDAARVEAVC